MQKLEEHVAAILEGTDPGEYSVLHDVASPFGNIDHIVLSRRGSVFLVETKATQGFVDHNGDELLVNGVPTEKDYLGQTLRNTMWLKDKIGEVTGSKPYVESILLFPSATVNIRQPLRGVIVSSTWYLSNYIRKHPNSTRQREHL